MRILLPWKISDEEEKYLQDKLSNHDLYITRSNNIAAALSSGSIQDADILIAGNANRDIIHHGRNIKLIQSMISGVSHIDLDAAKERGIITASTKGANSDEVAEHAMMLLLSLAKNSKKYFIDVSNRVWDKQYSTNIKDKNLGIIGLGHIGSRVAHLAKAFGMNILAIRNRPYLQSDSSGIDYLGGRENTRYVLENSDFILLSVPKTRDTIHMINDASLKYIKPDSYLVNVSRGSIVDEKAVLTMILSRRLKAFATDVFENEPNPFRSELYHMPNVICTPHIAAYSLSSKIKCLDALIENIHAFSQGKQLRNCVDYELGY